MPGFTSGRMFAWWLRSFVLEYSLGANPMIHDLVEDDVSVKDGMIVIPDRPGLGFTIAEKFLEAHAYRS